MTQPPVIIAKSHGRAPTPSDQHRAPPGFSRTAWLHGKMLFGRVERSLVVVDPNDLHGRTLETLAKALPRLRYLHCICVLNSEGELASAASRTDPTEQLQQELSTLAADYSFSATLRSSSISEKAREVSADLIVLAPLSGHAALARAQLMLGLASRDGFSLLSLGREPAGAICGAQVAFVVDGEGAGVGALAKMAADLPPNVLIKTFAATQGAARQAELQSMLQAHVPGRELQVHKTVHGSLLEAFEAAMRESNSDLVVVPTDALSDLEAFTLTLVGAKALQDAQRPTLFLPRQHTSKPLVRDRLTVSDGIWLPHAPLLVHLERHGPLGRDRIARDESLVVVEAGQANRPLTHDRGVVALPPDWLDPSPGLHSLAVDAEPPHHGSAAAHVLRPERPLMLLDAGLDGLSEGSLRAHAKRFHLVFVRMRRTDSYEHLREKWGTYGAGCPLVIDASCWLDDHEADDVPSIVDGQRLLRVALSLISRGAQVYAVVDRGQPLHTHACEAFTPRTLPKRPAANVTLSPPPVADDALNGELTLFGESRPAAGHSVRVELDNAEARRSVLRQIDQARERIHVQSYIFEEDETGTLFAGALARAAARGVRVRILVDAVYSQHVAFGRRNAVLSGLQHLAGISVRAYRPVMGLPNLSALKRRNHRKLWVFDGRRAVLSGRNVGSSYYRAFHEVAIGRASDYRALPWLDCGAALEGPLVRDLDEAFLGDWQAAGGEPFDLIASPPQGSITARLVLHEGLRDTRTFDAQLALIRHAQRELTIVNTFPLVLELQQALLRALARGVRVRMLFGNIRPYFGHGEPFVGGRFRVLADQLVRARLDPIVSAGGEVYEYAIAPLPSWEAELERVFPHVHAKLLLRDRRDAALGSANLDVTAAYWESEAMLIVHDDAFTQSLDDAVSRLLESSRRIHLTESAIGETAQRGWLAHHWPSLLG